MDLEAGAVDSRPCGRDGGVNGEPSGGCPPPLGQPRLRGAEERARPARARLPTPPTRPQTSERRSRITPLESRLDRRSACLLRCCVGSGFWFWKFKDLGKRRACGFCGWARPGSPIATVHASEARPSKPRWAAAPIMLRTPTPAPRRRGCPRRRQNPQAPAVRRAAGGGGPTPNGSSLRPVAGRALSERQAGCHPVSPDSCPGSEYYPARPGSCPTRATSWMFQGWTSSPSS